MTLFHTIKCILCQETFNPDIQTSYKIVCINIYIVESIFLSMFTINILDTIKHIMNRKLTKPRGIKEITKLTCKFGGQWSKSSNICRMFCASCMIKFNSMSNSPPTNCNKIKSYSRLVLNTFAHVYRKKTRYRGVTLR